MLNKCILIGRLTGDPELRYTNNGKPVTNFTVAVERPFKNSNGDRKSDYIDIVAWQRLAESAAEYLKKGRLVAITGRLQIRENESEQGRNFINPEVVANVIKFLDSPNDNNSNDSPQNSSNSVDDSDVSGNSNNKPGEENTFDGLEVPF